MKSDADCNQCHIRYFRQSYIFISISFITLSVWWCACCQDYAKTTQVILIIIIKSHFYRWGTGIRGLMRGMATFSQSQRNQEILVVRDKDPQVSLG